MKHPFMVHMNFDRPDADAQCFLTSPSKFQIFTARALCFVNSLVARVLYQSSSLDIQYECLVITSVLQLPFRAETTSRFKFYEEQAVDIRVYFAEASYKIERLEYSTPELRLLFRNPTDVVIKRRL